MAQRRGTRVETEKQWRYGLRMETIIRKFFHQYANYRRNINTIWEIKDGNNELVSSFPNKVEARVSYFSNLFFEPVGCPIQEILEVVQKFPTVFTEEMNSSLTNEVSEEELAERLSPLCKMGKSPD
jgi:hypothetical protein